MMTNKKLTKIVANEVATQVSKNNQKNLIITVGFGLGSLVLSSLAAMNSNKKMKDEISSDINELADVYTENLASINEALNKSTKDRDAVLEIISKNMEKQTAVFEKMDFILNDGEEDSGEESTESETNLGDEDPSSTTIPQTED